MTEKALVIGGTGPTGPKIVKGLLDRGYDVTILHGGIHENPEIPAHVKDIHADPHFAETLEPAVSDTHYDLVIGQYGRLRTVVDVFAGKTGRLVAIGAATGMAAAPTSPAWGPMGKPALLTESKIIPETDEQSNKLAMRMAQAQDHLFEAHAKGAFSVTYLGYTLLYGPNQPGPQDWSIVRRVLDGRKQMVIADGGMRLETRGYSLNVANAVLLSVDKPDIAGGKSYIVCDEHTYTIKQRIEYVASVLGHSFEFVSLPWAEARPAHPYNRYMRDHRITDSTLIRQELGYVDEVTSAEGLAATARWLVDHPLERGGEIEDQIGDPFDYEGEDAIIAAAKVSHQAAMDVPYELPGWGHQYRHPKAPGEGWKRPEK